jgi:Protein of unknown function (DUF3455)
MPPIHRMLFCPSSRRNRPRRTQRAWFYAGWLSLAASVAGCFGAHAAPPAIPEALRAPLDEKPFTEARATGMQIYLCTANKEDTQHFDWVYTAPEANLYSPAGAPMGRHYAGPTWQATDGSKVVGEVVARDAGPDPTAVPWLLVHATATSGNGVFSRTSHIQRIFTSGGKPPAGGCHVTEAGHRLQVPYRATYVFYARGTP